VTVLLAGLLLGIAASVHCLGMCGPLVLVAKRPGLRSGGAAQFVAYHGSRIAVYLVLGTLAGLTGDVLVGFCWRVRSGDEVCGFLARSPRGSAPLRA